jgi:hypothetical protein
MLEAFPSLVGAPVHRWPFDLAAQPGQITRLLHTRCRIASAWDGDLWPVGTAVQVVAVEFIGQWGVVIERLDDYPPDWPDDADHCPFLELADFLRRLEPLRGES